MTISMIWIWSLNVASANESFNQKTLFLKAKQLVDIAYDKHYIWEQSSTSITRYFVSIWNNKTKILKTDVDETKWNCFGIYWIWKCIQPLDTDKRYTLNYWKNWNVNTLIEDYFRIYKKYRDLINNLVNKKLHKIKSNLIKKTYLKYKKWEITQAEKNSVIEQWNFMVNNFSTDFAKYIAFKKLVKTSNPIKYHLTYFNINWYTCLAKDEILHYNWKDYCNYTYERNFIVFDIRKQAIKKIKDFISWMKNEIRK